jgi:hypothetical protein
MKLRSVVLFFILLTLTMPLMNCGSSSSSDANTIRGIAAAGAPIVGIVNVKGAEGNTASATIGLDGSFSLNVSALTAPYILYATGTVYGESITIYSAGVATGNINITPITDFILRKALADSAEDAFDAWTSSSVTEETLDAAETEVQEQLAPILDAAGLTDDVDLVSGTFEADQTGLDAVLEAIDITYDETGTTATIENELTDSTYTDDVTTTTDDTEAGLPDDDANTEISDIDAISAVFRLLEELYETEDATATELNTYFAPYVADDFFEDGETKTEMLDSWVTGEEGPGVGLTLSATIEETFDVTGTDYTKGYIITIYYTDTHESGSLLTKMVYNGTKWLWYGNRRWLRTEARASARLIISPATMDTDIEITYTGLDVSAEDESNYAYNQGVRSTIVTGPGLPETGLVFFRDYPYSCFHIYETQNCQDNHIYCIADDTVISEISDGSVYTTRLYAELAANVTLANTALQTYTDTLNKSPVLNSELSASIFPTLTAPASHDIADLNIPGEVTVSWTNPANMTVDEAEISWYVGETNYYVENEVGSEGGTSVVLDATGLPAPEYWAYLWLWGSDDYGRDYSLSWEFEAMTQ